MAIAQLHQKKQEILQHLLKQGQATAQELAAAVAISAQATRRHLKDLEADGLIDYQSVQQGMGRPQHLYQLSHAGRDRFPHSHGEFAVSFLDAMVETVGENMVGEVLRKQWEHKAEEYRDRLGSGSLKERVSRLVELRKAEGYMAEVHVVEANDGTGAMEEQFVLAEHNCAISEVAESYPNICGHELEMFAAVLPDCVVERTHWLNNGEHSCGYLIQIRKSSTHQETT